MVTTEVFENLKSLQEILVQKYELEGKKSDAPKQLSNQEDLLAKTQKEFIEHVSYVSHCANWIISVLFSVIL